MAQDSHGGRRRQCRPDRAKQHAEIAVLTRLAGVWTLRAAIVDAGGEESWEELEGKLRQAKAELGEATGISACIRWLTVLYTLHRMEHVGYRGLIGAADVVSARVNELLGGVGGMSVRTIAGASRILERADLLDRWVYGRGRLAEAPDREPGPSPLPEGRKRPYRRPVSAWTLTTVAVSYWSAPARRRRSPRPVGPGPTSANLAENSLMGEERDSLSLPGDARSSSTVERRRPEQLNAVSAAAADEVEHGAPAPGASRERLASAVPRRRYSWRPRPREPNDLGNARQALLYDLETLLIRHRRRDRGELLAAVEAELSPARWIAAVERQADGVASARARGSGIDWSQWIWHWRDLPLETRNLVCSRMILPALLAHLRRVELWRLPQLEEVTPDGEIVRAHISRGRCCARAPDPGPRAVPQLGAIQIAAPEPGIAERPRAAPRSPPEEADDRWLRDLQRRHGGEEGDDG